MAWHSWNLNLQDGKNENKSVCGEGEGVVVRMEKSKVQATRSNIPLLNIGNAAQTLC